jgi:hypothetical protein
MSAAYAAVTVTAAAIYAYTAWIDFTRAPWILDNMTLYGVPHSWLFLLGVLKAAGALGLLVGLAVPLIGVAAAIGLVTYFAGAVVTVLRARCYAHLPFPVLFLLPAAGSLALWLASR